MRNVTISLDDELARKARVAAAERDMSLSKFIADLLRKEVASDSGYEEAMHEYLAESPYVSLGRGEKLPSREEMHDRPVLRRH